MGFKRPNRVGFIHGVGINDANYSISTTVDGKCIVCKFYERFTSMLNRAYSKKNISTAEGVCPEWIYFSNFKAWMETQTWEGLHLDKDILIPGNKIYSPEACCFVPQRINNVINYKGRKGGQYPIGVTRQEYSKGCIKPLKNQYYATITTVDFDGNRKEAYLGFHRTPEEAHKTWQWAKALEIEKAVVWYEAQNCFRTDVADALMARVWKLRLEAANSIETKSL